MLGTLLLCFLKEFLIDSSNHEKKQFYQFNLTNNRLFSAKHKLLEQHNGEFEKMVRPSNSLSVFSWQKKNLCIQFPANCFSWWMWAALFSYLAVKGGGGLKISEFFFLKWFGPANFRITLLHTPSVSGKILIYQFCPVSN